MLWVKPLDPVVTIWTLYDPAGVCGVVFRVIQPVDVQVSDVTCTVEHEADGSLSLRLGLNYVRSLKAKTAQQIVATREIGGAFTCVESLTLRVPSLSRGDLAQLARIGALNKVGGVEHRRDALWQVEQACGAAVAEGRSSAGSIGLTVEADANGRAFGR